MLYALSDPLSFVVLVASFVVVVTLHGWVASLVADRFGDRRPRLEQRLRLDPRRHVDPFGAVAAALGGLGWPRGAELPVRGSRGALVAVTLVAPVLDLVIGSGLLLTASVTQGLDLTGLSTAMLLTGLQGPGAVATGLVLSGLVATCVGLVSLLPLPPLDGGRLMLALAPRTAGWQRAQHLLVEQNVGTVVLLVLLVLPLGGARPVLLSVLDLVVAPIARLVSGG